MSINEKESKDNLILKIISFFLPLVGLIIYAVNISKNPKIAKKCGKLALIGLGISLIQILLCWLIDDISKIDYTVILALLPIILCIAIYVCFIVYINDLGNEIKQPKGLLYISAFMPIIGLVLYCVYVKKEEELGVNCGQLALIGIALSLICLFLMFIFGVLKVSI